MNQNRILIKHLSPSRQRLLMCMHRHGSGRIRNLPVVAGEPIVGRCRLTVRRRLEGQGRRRAISRNFRLKPAQLRLLETLDEVHDGVLACIEFEEGLPREIHQQQEEPMS